MANSEFAVILHPNSTSDMSPIRFRHDLIRLAVEPDWWKVPFGKVNVLAVVIGTAIPMMMHPGELLAAFVWYSMITALMVWTKNIRDCVAAHAVTNLLLGLYVVYSGAWHLM